MDEGEERAQFEYSVRADGRRTGAIERFWDEQQTQIAENSFEWVYDAADRLVQEEATSTAFEDYALDWTYDLTGNRNSQVHSTQTAVRTTEYEYDANDRLLREEITAPSVLDEVLYTYNFTQQASKVEQTQASVIRSQATLAYNLQGRLSEVETTRYETVGGTPTTIETVVAYEYDSAGNRVASTVTTDESGAEETTRTEYLTDDANHTGYSQVLQQTTFDDQGTATGKVIYTTGHDQISQTRSQLLPDGVTWSAEVTDVFVVDGHGSVRMLLDEDAAVVVDTENGSAQQVYHFDAYGNLLNFASGVLPLTAYLYSGESFDFNIGQQYLRARWYDATTGRFNRLDPFAGNASDPQSFHKYAYVHGDPVNGVDPTGMFLQILIPTLIEGSLRNGDAARGAQALNTAYKLQRAVRIYQKAMRVLNKIRDAYDTVADTIDMLSIDFEDLGELRQQAVELSKGVMPGKYKGPLTIKLPPKLLDKLAVVFKYSHNVLSHNNTQEFVGELMTDVLAYALGFEQADLNWHKVHGPDQVVKHTQVAGLWGVLEAKGGTHGLNQQNTKYGTQMSKEWITGWLTDIIRDNWNKDRDDLREAVRAKKPMLALVSRLDIRRKGRDGITAKYEIGIQTYNPPKGNGLKVWKGFQ